MIYYKDNERKPYAYEDGTDPKYIKAGLTEIDKAEFDEIVKGINTPTPEQILQQQIAEAKAYLQETDHKFINGYVPRPDEDLDAILAERNAKREFIRKNEP